MHTCCIDPPALPLYLLPQNLSEMSKEESAMIILYPYEGSDDGHSRNIANAAVALQGRVGKVANAPK